MFITKKSGNRAYIVAPSIEENEESDLISGEALYETENKICKG